MKKSVFAFTLILLNFLDIFALQPADLIIFNAKIRTLDESIPQAEAVAVAQNKILAVGKNADVQKLSNDNTKKVDAQGNLVLPGFNDAHVHFLNMGMQFFSFNFRGIANEDNFVKRVSYYAEFLPKGAWIFGSGWNREKLDLQNFAIQKLINEASPENPLFIFGTDLKSALINAKTFEIAGKNKTVGELKNLGFEFDENGNSNGVVRGAGVNFVRNFAPRDFLADKLAIAEAAANYAARFGVTSVQDMQQDDNTEIYRKLQAAGKLKTRIYDCFPLFNGGKYTDQKIVRAPSAEMIRTGCFKFLTDAEDTDTTKLSAQITLSDKNGWQVMLHAIGKTANKSAIQFFENAIKENGKRDSRFRIEHAHNLDIGDIPRLKKFGIIPSVQPFLFYGGTFDDSEPYRLLLDEKVFPAFGSDSFMIEINPLLGIYAAVKKSDEYSNVSNQSLTVEEAVRAYTIGSAYAEFQEKIKGTISKGKLADMVILSKDIFTTDTEEIPTAKVLLTIVDGKIVYQAQ